VPTAEVASKLGDLHKASRIKSSTSQNSKCFIPTPTTITDHLSLNNWRQFSYYTPIGKAIQSILDRCSLYRFNQQSTRVTATSTLTLLTPSSRHYSNCCNDAHSTDSFAISTLSLDSIAISTLSLQIQTAISTLFYRLNQPSTTVIAITLLTLQTHLLYRRSL
jgi:hypothetical protein